MELKVDPELLERIAKEYVSWCECEGCEKYRTYCKQNGIIPTAASTIN